ncbi:DNA repair protein RecO [Candidatus Roizmanbacteria bacterium RIFCSPLOWO2_12_FULL_40_12]|uniref:DNA repair protein RecO n=1 Tax=Candidatus Roizmanbacteria bacterium RIFCSPLOWO2_01_FULL_40_42 TaxID=1802066 RepID=A0A1F7J4P0_9BACT|nr:MAG: DNA repair protein RecO [Candidatus Roizmanbacteria bacterium RIFCSPHIGHO2_01_FULL_40_98]OGK27336.1 MAG: DNA repair protein RecO [Candidatus Roizmanbacteria bacterium RIFCSPHIGHO2_02_FULL_40_53]OGK30792.1 MAG: DNA repair protein RecO [Candidatus Roizmanbacteria bacterium RIFCSPHIGHO2_12_41_18]OGK36441.1 MAG: DNA repair protein RecO [Candidatus Roizmanbacteria bacterium RIFCSPHIGHO2_12_FULL_40_130]OGK50569.1 MAG: DNA repair protein RecO [Candidatus Roizmanbacteria bacterium RIFCSPLOWO2_0
MPRNIQTDAFILKKKNLPTKDSIITIFSKDHGKLSVFAKGVRTFTSRRLPHLQTGNLVTATLAKSKERYYLQETVLLSAFSEIKKDPVKLSYMYFLFFVVDRLLPEAQMELSEYVLVKRYISALAQKKKEPNLKDLEHVLNTLLAQLGYLHEDDKEKDIEELRVTIEQLINEKLPFFII